MFRTDLVCSSSRNFIFVFLLILSLPALAEDVDPLNDGSQYAWFPNGGWINAEPLGNGGPGLSFNDNDLSGWLWSANTGWISLSCENTASCGTVDYRVTHDGAGNLGGYAWSPNLGWISFSCANTASCANVQYATSVDLSTGDMSGYAYAANAGWIGFSCVNTASCGTIEYRVTLDLTPAEQPILQDGFEDLL